MKVKSDKKFALTVLPPQSHISTVSDSSFLSTSVPRSIDSIKSTVTMSLKSGLSLSFESPVTLNFTPVTNLVLY